MERQHKNFSARHCCVLYITLIRHQSFPRQLTPSKRKIKVLSSHASRPFTSGDHFKPTFFCYVGSRKSCEARCFCSSKNPGSIKDRKKINIVTGTIVGNINRFVEISATRVELLRFTSRKLVAIDTCFEMSTWENGWRIWVWRELIVVFSLRWKVNLKQYVGSW